MTVCTVFLKVFCRTSFKSTASSTADTVPNTRLITLMASVLRMASKKSGRLNSHLKLLRPIQGVMPLATSLRLP